VTDQKFKFNAHGKLAVQIRPGIPTAKKRASSNRYGTTTACNIVLCIRENETKEELNQIPIRE